MKFLSEKFYSPHDSEVDRKRKDVFIPVVLAVTVMTTISIITDEEYGSWNLWETSGVVMLCCNCIILLKNFVSKKLHEFDIIFTMFAWTYVIICVDIHRAYEMEERFWPCVVLVLNVVLVCSLPSRVGTGLLSMVVVYLLFDIAERTTRFGLYEISGSRSLKKMKGCFPNLPDSDFDSAPCKVGIPDAFRHILFYIAILIIDFVCTHHFARGLVKEQQKLRDSIKIAETVASALVRFDLDAAQQHIENEKTELTEILMKLLQNLQQYRPYLPDSLFELSEECHSCDKAKPPSGPNAAIVFTDLKSSTAIWEASPDAMKKALKIHNKIIRTCISNNSGYEVKTIGDSFMVAFECLADGCSFAMEVQEQFVTADWPPELVLPSAFESNNWHGLIVRIGIHYGEVEPEISTVSGRTDYYGRTVNRAARLEGACIPGGIAIDSSEIPKNLEPNWTYTVITETLKGINKPASITVLLLKGDNSFFEESRLSIKSLKSSIATAASSPSIIMLPTIEQNEMITRKSATVCTVRVLKSDQDVMHLINHSLGKCINCMERTEGSIVTVLSRTIVIGWNTVRPLSAHVHNCLTFASLMFATFSTPGGVFIGISSSSVSCGRVGTNVQKFITVFGSCVNMSVLLCQASCDIQTFALCATTPLDHLISRPIDRWHQYGTETVIYEIRIEKMKDWISSMARRQENNKSLPPLANDVEWGWGFDYINAFNTYDWETIVECMAPSDTVLGTVADMIRRGKSLRVKVST